MQTWVHENDKSWFKTNKEKQQTEYRFKSNDVSVSPIEWVVTCESLNIYFHWWGPTLADNIPKPSRTPDIYLFSDLTNSMFQVSTKEIGRKINGLPHSTPGHNDLTSGTLRSCLSSLTSKSLFISYLSLPGGWFSSDKKMNYVTPLL